MMETPAFLQCLPYNTQTSAKVKKDLTSNLRGAAQCALSPPDATPTANLEAVMIRRLMVLGSVIELHVEGELVEPRVASALADVPESLDEPLAMLTLSEVGDGRAQLTGATPWQGEMDITEAIPRLITALNRAGLDLTTDALGIHSAAFESDGGAHALVAQSGVGKTSLLVELMRRGYAGMSDEMFFLDPLPDRLRWWPKPLSIKPSSTLELPSTLEDFDGISFRTVPLTQIGTLASEPSSLESIILLRRGTPVESPQSERLSPGDALVALADHVLNFRAVGASTAMSLLARAVSTSATWVLDLADPTSSAAYVSDRLKSSPHNDVSWELLAEPPSPAVSGCVSVALGDEVVVWSALTEQLIGLDSVAAQLWRALCEGDASDILQHRGFARDLVGHGLIERDAMTDRIRDPNL
jgi:hypothetical protein